MVYYKGEIKMTIYQKAIKVRKVCESRITCKGCIYADKCINTQYLLFTPLDEDIKDNAEAIQKEKWKVK